LHLWLVTTGNAVVMFIGSEGGHALRAAAIWAAHTKGVMNLMGIGVSLLLIAAGAILTWAVEATLSGVNIHTVGVILMVVGFAGLVISLVFWSSLGFGRTDRRTTVVDDGPRV
jgi:hypothetical protein